VRVHKNRCAIILRAPIVLSAGVTKMTCSKACRGRIGIAFFALGFSLAEVAIRAHAGGTTASGTSLKALPIFNEL
jgi:hypothetical protein